MKKSILFLLLLLSSVFVSCSSDDKVSSDEVNNGLEIIKIDLSEAREGKLSEFFEPEIEYLWLKDDSEESQLNGGLHKILFYKGKILTLDIFGCKCIKIFDSEGNYLSKIRAYGEGPEKYLDLDNFTIVKNEVLLLGLYPPKLMWFSLEGDFLREEKLNQFVGAGIYSQEESRYYFFSNFISKDEYFITSVNDNFKDTLQSFLFDPDRYYGNSPARENFSIGENIYLGRPYHDTIMMISKGEFIPKLIFDFGEYSQPIDELEKQWNNPDSRERLNFINNRAKLYFDPNYNWFISEAQLYAFFSYMETSFNVFFDRKNQKTHVLNKGFINDIDEGVNTYFFNYQFDQDKIGHVISGKDLFRVLQKKKEELGQEAFEEYVKGKGKNFAQVAFEAKDSENPVLIVYTPKK